MMADIYGQAITGVKVVDALTILEDHYQVRFSYSKDVVPYNETIALVLNRRSLIQVLEDLGAQTGIIYRQRGTRVVLNYDPARKVTMAQGSAVLIREMIVLDSTDRLYPAGEREDQVNNHDQTPTPLRDSVSLLTSLELENKLLSLSGDSRQYEARGLTLEEDAKQWLQVSILPVRSVLDRKAQKINHLSLNVVAGYTGGLEGFELGGFSNSVKNDVKGVQVAGFANTVGGHVEGLQLSGFSNFNRGIMRGIQLAGFSNINVQADAMQIAGAFNLNRRISRGYQVAGLFNAGRNIAGGQLAGFLNVSMGSVYFQSSGFCNVAEKVDFQISGLVNVAKKVGFLQLGLINVADTVSGLSFGLLNLIRKGYNRVEISLGDALYGNLSVKLGTRNFYNIFQVGTNFRRNLEGTGLTWGYGYGFGFFQNISKGMKFNPEVLVSNIQEKRIIRPDLNLLNQVKFLFHFTENSQIEIFAGPTFNFMISKLTLENGVLVGSGISRYVLHEKNYLNLLEPINTKFWIGFNAGIRI